jgi:hypothetical protein
MSGELFSRPDEEMHKPEHSKFYDSDEDDKSYERYNSESNEYDNEEHYKREKKTRRDNFEKYTNE